MADFQDIPAPPVKPSPLECCKRGCDPCIMDYYEIALERWRKRVEAMGVDPDAALLGWEM